MVGPHRSAPLPTRSRHSRGGALRIPAPPLDAADVAQLLGTIARALDQRTGAALAIRLLRHTAGVPLYVLELLKALPPAPAAGGY